MNRFLRLGLVLSLIALWAGCGDTFRPIIIPNPPAFPDPRAAHTIISINNNNGDADQGSAMEIDVSGDTVVDVGAIGIAPVHAVQQTSVQVLAVNQVDNSLTKLTFLGGIFNPTTISLPSGSAPNFVAVAPNDTNAYVSLPGGAPQCAPFPCVAVVNTNANNIPGFINVGSNPVALAVTPDKNRLYVANQGDSTISGFNTVDRRPRNPPMGLGSPPIWVLSRSDNQRVYVLEQDGTVATLDTSLNAGPDTVVGTVGTVSGATYMIYDGLLNRLYVPGADASSNPVLAVLDVSQSTAQVLKTVQLSQTATTATALAVAALPDTSRVYAAWNGAAQTTTIGTISSVSGDGIRATYTFDPNTVTGSPVQLGMGLLVSGVGDGFDGNFIVSNVSGNTFAVANTTSGSSSAPGRTATGTNFLPQVTVISTSGNTLKTTIAMPAVPAAGPFEAPVCSTARFRFTMAAAGDSSRVYLASCDGGNVNLIRTSDDTYLVSTPGPPSARTPIPPSNQPPPQNPVFLLAGP